MPQLRKRKPKENIPHKVKKDRKEESNIFKSVSKKKQTETFPISVGKAQKTGVKRKKKNSLLYSDEELHDEITKNKKAVIPKSLCNKENIKLEENTRQDCNKKAEPDDSDGLNFSSFTDSGIASENLSDFINETIIKSELSSSFSNSQDKVNDSSNSESEWEEVEDKSETDSLDDYKPEIPKEGVEITIDCPELRIKKRKKRKFDRNEWIRLHINRIRKETQLYVHKTHLLCLLAHGLYVNKILNSNTIKSFALSLIPNHMFALTAGKKVDKIDISGIEKIVSWFRGAFSFEQKCGFLNPFVSLIKSFQTTVALNSSEYNLLFIVFARILGFKVRYCVSLYPLSYKASNLLKKPKNKRKTKKSKSTDDPEMLNDEKSNVKKSKCLENSNKSKKTRYGNKIKNHKSKKEETISKTPRQKEENLSRIKRNAVTENKEKNFRSLRSNLKNYKLSSNENDDDTIDEDFELDYDSSDEDSKNRQNYKSNRKCAPKNKTLDSKISRPRRSTLKSYKLSSDEDNNNTNDEDFKADYDSSDEDFKNAQKIKFKRKHESKSKPSNRKILSSESFSQQSDFDTESVICWAEIYSKAEKSWISIECSNNIINKPYDIEKVARNPVSYILAFDNESFVKDVTRRYCNEYMTTTVKLRIDSDWWDETLKPFLPPNSMQNKAEEKKLEEMLVNKPLPTSIQGFKNHPLYALTRHLLKFEGIYPPGAPPVGFIRGEPIYPRDCVHQLHPREKWLKKARVVKIGEQPYKVVKCPRWDKINKVILKGVPIELFGLWQTEEYEPPVAVNGIVPRNEYGNVDLFEHSMLPRGTVYLNLPGLNRIAKKLGIDCSPAIVGFEARKGFPHPILEGFVICEEFKDTILAAWDEEQENIRKKEKEKREKRVYGNWKKLIKGLMIHERIKLKYNIDSKEKN